MNCPNCKKRISASSNFCNACGYKINNIQEKTIKTDEEKESIIEDYTEELIDTFIGSGREDIKKGKFSIPAFFFGPIYYYYRKLNVEATILLILKLAVYLFLGSKYFALSICISLYTGFTFKRHYMNFVRESVTNIKYLNISGKKEHAMLAAINKGGTTATPVVVISTLYFFSLVALCLYMFIPEESLIEENEQTNNVPDVETLYYTVPDKFYKDRIYKSDYYELYKTSDRYCSFYVYKKYINGYSTDTKPNKSVEHLAKYIRDEDDELVINGNTWYHDEEIKDKNTTHELTYTGEFVEYKVTFNYVDDEEHQYCSDAYQELRDSLELRVK